MVAAHQLPAVPYAPATAEEAADRPTDALEYRVRARRTRRRSRRSARLRSHSDRRLRRPQHCHDDPWVTDASLSASTGFRVRGADRFGRGDHRGRDGARGPPRETARQRGRRRPRPLRRGGRRRTCAESHHTHLPLAAPGSPPYGSAGQPSVFLPGIPLSAAPSSWYRDQRAAVHPAQAEATMSLIDHWARHPSAS